MAFRTLAPGDSERAAKTGLSRGRGVSTALLQQQFAFESVDFSLIVPLACALYDRQCLRHTTQALRDLPTLPMRLSEHAEKPRPRERCPRGPIALQALAHRPNPGIYLEVVENEKIVVTDAYTSAWVPSQKPFMTAIIAFEDLGGGKTRYTAVARHWTAEDRKAHDEMGFHTGWGQCAEQMAALAAKI